jgi:hypothetical protein
MAAVEQDSAVEEDEEKKGRRRDTLYWGIVLIWAGVVFGAKSLGILPTLGRADEWNWVFFGAGLLALPWSIRRAAAPDHPDPITSMWNLVWAGVMLILGLGPLSPVRVGIPLILLLIGAALLGTALYTADQSLSPKS